MCHVQYPIDTSLTKFLLSNTQPKSPEIEGELSICTLNQTFKYKPGSKKLGLIIRFIFYDMLMSSASLLNADCLIKGIFSLKWAPQVYFIS